MNNTLLAHTSGAAAADINQVNLRSQIRLCWAMPTAEAMAVYICSTKMASVCLHSLGLTPLCGACCRARLVIGADGVRSVIRSSMCPSDPGPRFLVSPPAKCCSCAVEKHVL